MQPRNIVKNNSGAAVIEFALILPVLLLILLGVIEFGVYFMKEQIVQRTVSTTASAIQLDPNNEMNKDNAYSSGTSLVDYTVNGNYICAKSYSKSADAKAGLCDANDGWVTTPPTDDTTGAPYYVALVAYVQKSSFTELFKNYIPPIEATSVFKVGGGGGTVKIFNSSNTPGINVGTTLLGKYNFCSIAGSQTGNDTSVGNQYIVLSVDASSNWTLNANANNNAYVNIVCVK